MKIVIIGGTGLIGSKTAAILRQAGHDVAAVSPRTGVNTITGEGLKEGLTGADVVVDLSKFAVVRRQGRAGILRSLHTQSA